MRSKLLLLLISILTSLSVYSQDTIVRANGSIILCKIQREDSSSVYITLKKGGNDMSTFVNKSDIASIKYETKQVKPRVQFDKITIGLGLGMDYGGIGGSLLIYPQTNFGLFLGGGYALAGFGYNVGVKIRLITERHTSIISPYLIGMYGYNSAIVITNATDYSKLFYGPTFGFGMDFRSRRARIGYWTLAILFPIRGSDVSNYIDDLKNNHGATFSNDLSPVAFSIGYRFILN